MTTRSYKRQNCPVAHALSIVGDQWTILIIRDVLSGPQRFDKLQQNLGISRNLLSRRLKQMIDMGLLVRRQIPDTRRYAYALTPKALELRPTILALAEWGQKWREEPGGSRVEITEKATGRPVGVRYCRLDDGREVKSSDIAVQRLPGRELAQ